MISRTDHEIVQCSCGKIIYYLSMSLSSRQFRSYNHETNDKKDGCSGLSTVWVSLREIADHLGVHY